VGLLSGLLLLPVTAPLRGLRLVLEQLQVEAEAALHDSRRLRAELFRLSMRLEIGEIDEAEYEAQEARLLERLNALDARRLALEAEYRLYDEPDTPDPGADREEGL
jgi:hypothetical protein